VSGQRVLRVAELISADATAVTARAAELPRRMSAAVSEVASGTLLTLELQRRWWDRRPRGLVLARLERALRLVERDTEQVRIVAAALLADGAVLVGQRTHPPRLAELWEFPGGKVERGETLAAALVRECAEELGVRIVPGPELARQLLDTGAVLVLLQAELAEDSPAPQPLEHKELRWARAGELTMLDWVPTNRQFVTDVTGRL
jgi:8-oxo-dGTP diphosphatase